jgi:hypothetical protein
MFKSPVLARIRSLAWVFTSSASKLDPGLSHRDRVEGNGRGSTSDDGNGEHKEPECVGNSRHGKSW